LIQRLEAKGFGLFLLGIEAAHQIHRLWCGKANGLAAWHSNGMPWLQSLNSKISLAGGASFAILQTVCNTRSVK
jgi:hypothetical protein